MAILSWGKPGLYIRKIGEGDTTASSSTSDGNIKTGGQIGEDKWLKLPDPVEDSTQLTTTKGDKTEAKVEGGENEAVRYGKNTYALAFNIRAAAGRKRPVADSDGLIDGEFSLVLVPENPAAPALKIDRGTLSVEDSWTAADGGIWAYTLDALKPDSGDQVKWGTATVNGSTGTFTEENTDETSSASGSTDQSGNQQASDSGEEGISTASSRKKTI